MSKWPLLWEGKGRRGLEEAADERDWVTKDFLGGSKTPFIGNLGSLLGEYEEERENERFRTLRREKAAKDAQLPEEDEDTEEDDDDPALQANSIEEPVFEEEIQRSFERLIKEKFIYGLLEVIVALSILKRVTLMRTGSRL